MNDYYNYVDCFLRFTGPIPSKHPSSSSVALDDQSSVSSCQVGPMNWLNVISEVKCIGGTLNITPSVSHPVKPTATWPEHKPVQCLQVHSEWCSCPYSPTPSWLHQTLFHQPWTLAERPLLQPLLQQQHKLSSPFISNMHLKYYICMYYQQNARSK